MNYFNSTPRYQRKLMTFIVLNGDDIATLSYVGHRGRRRCHLDELLQIAI